jgi:hypothetical protein
MFHNKINFSGDTGSRASSIVLGVARDEICIVGEERPRRQDETGSPARGKVRDLTVGGLDPVLACPFHLLFLTLPLSLSLSMLRKYSCLHTAESYFFRSASAWASC